MQRILIVYNPRSSRYSDVKNEVLDKVTSLKGYMIGKYEVEKTDVDKNAEKFIKEYSASESELAKSLTEEVELKQYFEGIDYFETLFNPDLKPLVELLSDDYLIVFDDYTKTKAKYETIEQDLSNLYNENLTGALTLPLSDSKHFKLSEFLSLIADKQKIYFGKSID